MFMFHRSPRLAISFLLLTVVFTVACPAQQSEAKRRCDSRNHGQPERKSKHGAGVVDVVAAFRAVTLGFPLFAGMLILGSIWASIAWSSYWGWDPKETSALATSLVYAVYLHARSQRGWQGRPAALLLVLGFVAVLLTYSGNLWFSGLHTYSGL